MKAAYITDHGGPEVVQVGTLPDKVPGPGLVRVRVKAAALNHLDLFVRGGIPGIKLTFPHIPGSDGAGVVDAVGEGVTAWKPGDEVVLNAGVSCGSCEFCRKGEDSLCVTFHLLGEHIDGTFAEWFVAKPENLARKPEHLSWDEAAAFPLTFLTAWRMIVSKARILPGETMLVVGIGGGVALASLQIAKAMGLTVFVTSGSEEKLAKAKKLGADAGILHGRDDMSREIRRITGKRGVDVVVDSVGKATWKSSIACAARGGRLVTCGGTTGTAPEEDIARIFWNQLSIFGSTMATQREFAQVVAFVKATGIKPVVDRVFTLDEARAAQEYLEGKQQFGKVVVTVGA